MTNRRRNGKGLCYVCLLCLAVFAGSTPALCAVVIDANFDLGDEGFSYQDDTFRGSSAPAYASGSHVASGGLSGGALRVDLGGIDSADIDEISGGWTLGFNLPAAQHLEIRLAYRLTQTQDHDDNERSQAMFALDGSALGAGGADFVAEVEGVNGDSGDRSTGWRSFRRDLGTLGPGAHTITVGGYNDRKTSSGESTTVLIDDVRVQTFEPELPDLSIQAIVGSLELNRFQQSIASLEGFVTRQWSEQENLDAGDWIEAELASYGYVVERHGYIHEGQPRDNIYATKVGNLSPDEMYIVSGHMDSRNSPMSNSSFAPGADDDGSGTALVLEVARAFADPTVHTERSIRFILWNNEETGLDGSDAYVVDRRGLQGLESPAGSGQYPEPTWLGILQHDMILFDHGLPPQANQIPGADIDIEYQSAAGFLGDAIDLALSTHAGNRLYATDYPAEVSADMNNTDSKSFQWDCPAISLRENRRLAEIGNGSNPHWHQSSDQISTYSAEDFLFGFNVVQTTTAAIAQLAGATVVSCGDGIVPPAEGCDDGGLTPGDGCNGACQVEPDWTCTGQPSNCRVCRTRELNFPDTPDDSSFVWAIPDGAVCAESYDVVRGALGPSIAPIEFTSAVCLIDDLGTASWSDSTSPPPGEGLWFLTRIDADSWSVPDATVLIRDTDLTACP